MASAKRKAPSKAAAAVPGRVDRASRPARSKAGPRDATARARAACVPSSTRCCPSVDGGRFPAKRIAGEAVAVEAHCFTDGHDKLRVVLRWKLVGSANADYEVDMTGASQRCVDGGIHAAAAGRYQCTVMAWVDHFESWRREFERREDKERYPRGPAKSAPHSSTRRRARAAGSDAAILTEWSGQLRDSLEDAAADVAALRALALDPARAAIVARYADRSLAASARRWI